MYTNVVYNCNQLCVFRKDVGGGTLDEEMREQLDHALSSSDGIVGYQLTSKLFIVKAEVSAMCPLGWVHVYKSELGKIECGFR